MNAKIKNKKHAFAMCNGVLISLMAVPFQTPNRKTKSLKKVKKTIDLINEFLQSEEDRLKY